MQTNLIPLFQGTPEGEEAERILRSCVHCGFCNATCPTYQALGNELDGPRGRIYLIKQMLEGEVVSEKTRVHLDRCLSCRSCETTCPSGVDYHRLLDIGREELNSRLQRPVLARLSRKFLALALGNRRVFAVLLKVGRIFRPLLPSALKGHVPPAPQPLSLGSELIGGASAFSARKVLLLEGCVQDAFSPEVNQATRLVLAHFGIACVTQSKVQCCGAMSFHLDETARARETIRRNIDLWWPLVSSGDIDAIVVNASGCGVFVKGYESILAAEPAYLDKARRIVALVKDPVELLSDEDWSTLRPEFEQGQQPKVAFHAPCSLQHGLKLGGKVERILSALGCELKPVADAHLCCGSAGTYSLLQAGLSQTLKARKLTALEQAGADEVLSANIGCQVHLSSREGLSVKHWLVFVAEMLTKARSESV